MNHKFIITFLLVIIATVLSNSQVRGVLDDEVDSIEDFEVEDMSPDLDQEDMALDLDEGHRDLGYGRSFSRSGRPSCYRRSPRRQYECCRRRRGRARGCRKSKYSSGRRRRSSSRRGRRGSSHSYSGKARK